MNEPADVERIAATAFRALQLKARDGHGGNTQPLLVVYAVESFLRRLAISRYRQQMVLKGGMLMAASAIRQMTKDADLSTHGVPSDEARVRDVVTEISRCVPDPHEGVRIDPDSIRTAPMREDDAYQGVRTRLVAMLGKAKIPFALDFSFGDPRISTTIELDSVIDGRPAVNLEAYPLSLNLAEKIVTAMQRRETSTRDRDFADLWVASRRHDLGAPELRRHLEAVARHREQPLMTLRAALEHMPDRQTPYTAMVQRMAYMSPPPEQYRDLIADVIAFVDPIVEPGHERLLSWDAQALSWTSTP